MRDSWWERGGDRGGENQERLENISVGVDREGVPGGGQTGMEEIHGQRGRRRRRKGQLSITVGMDSEREEKGRERDLIREREGSREKIGELVVKDKGMEG